MANIMGIPIDDPTPETQQLLEALAKVISERTRQLAKWGRQRHNMGVWSLVLSEEVGEFSQAILSQRAATFARDVTGETVWLRKARNEAVHVAAVAVAMIEHLDEVLWERDPDGEQATSEASTVHESGDGQAEEAL